MASPAPLLPLLTEHLEPLRELCRRYGVERLEVFGSAAKGTFDPATSDLDFIASFRDPMKRGYCDRFCGFVDAAEALLGRSVDLLTERMICNPYLREELDESASLNFTSLKEFGHDKGIATYSTLLYNKTPDWLPI